MNRFLFATVALLIAVLPSARFAQADASTPFLPELEPITVENVDRIRELQQIGLGRISGLSWSQDSAMLVVATPTGIWLYETSDLETPHLLQSSDGSAITSAVIHPEGTILAVLLSPGDDESEIVQLWNVESGEVIRQFNVPRYTYAVQFSPDGELLAASSTSPDGFGSVLVWKVNTGERIYYDEIRWPIGSVSFSADGTLLIYATYEDCSWCANYEGEQSFWHIINLETGEALDELGALSRTDYKDGPFSVQVVSVSLSPDGSILVSRERNGDVRFWDVNSGMERPILPSGDHFIRVSPDGALLVLGSDSDLRLQDVVSGDERTIVQGYNGAIQFAVFSLNAERLATVDYDQTIHIWNVTSGTELKAITAHIHQIRAIAFPPDRTMLFIADWWNIRYRNLALDLDQTVLSSEEWINSMAVSADGETFAFSKQDNIVRVWNSPIWSETYALEGHTAPVRALGFSPNGHLLASGGGYGDGTIRLWNMESGDTETILDGDDTYVENMAFSPDGRLLAAAAERGVHLWRLSDNIQLALLPSTVWTGRVVFSPDGHWLATTGNNYAVKVWNVDEVIQSEDAAETLTLEGHTGWISALAFSADATILASADNDYPYNIGGSAIRLWNLATGEPLTVFVNPTGGISSLTFSQDGKLLASGGSDGQVRLWGVPAA